MPLSTKWCPKCGISLEKNSSYRIEHEINILDKNKPIINLPIKYIRDIRINIEANSLMMANLSIYIDEEIQKKLYDIMRLQSKVP